MERFLAEVCTPDWNLSLDAGRPFAEAVAELAAAPPGERQRIEAYHRRWLEMVAGPIAPHGGRPGGAATRAACRLWALTNWSAETFALVRHDPAYAFLDRFRTIFVSGELRLVKPEPGDLPPRAGRHRRAAATLPVHRRRAEERRRGRGGSACARTGSPTPRRLRAELAAPAACWRA